MDKSLGKRNAGVGQGVAEAALPIAAGRGLLRAHQRGDPTVAIGDEPGADLPRPFGVVRDAADLFGAGNRAIQHHVRNVATGQGGRQGRVQSGRGQHDPVNGLVEEAVVRRCLIQVLVLGKQHQSVAVMFQRGVNRSHQLGIQRVPEVGHHRHPPRAPRRKTPADRARDVVQSLRGPSDALPRVEAHPRILSERS